MSSPSPDPPKTARRWFQFSLRTFLVFVTITCVLLGLAVRHIERGRRQARAVERLLGASAVRLLPSRDLVWREWIFGIETLRLEDTQNLPVEELQALTDLRSLTINQLRYMKAPYAPPGTISDSILRHISKMEKLEQLDLRGCHITDAGLEHLKSLRHLRVFRFSSESVTSAGVRELFAALPNLELCERDPVAYGFRFPEGKTRRWLQTGAAIIVESDVPLSSE